MLKTQRSALRGAFLVSALACGVMAHAAPTRAAPAETVQVTLADTVDTFNSTTGGVTTDVSMLMQDGSAAYKNMSRAAYISDCLIDAMVAERRSRGSGSTKASCAGQPVSAEIETGLEILLTRTLAQGRSDTFMLEVTEAFVHGVDHLDHGVEAPKLVKTHMEYGPVTLPLGVTVHLPFGDSREVQVTRLKPVSPVSHRFDRDGKVAGKLLDGITLTPGGGASAVRLDLGTGAGPVRAMADLRYSGEVLVWPEDANPEDAPSWAIDLTPWQREALANCGGAVGATRCAPVVITADAKVRQLQ